MQKNGKIKKNFNFLGVIYYWLLKNLVTRLVAFVWLCKVNGQENVPVGGNFLILANHQSYLDFLLLIFVFRKSPNLVFFIKDDYFNKRLWRFALLAMGQLSADKLSLKKASKILREGQGPVVIFPEGTRTRTGELNEINPGFTVITKSVPGLFILPVGIKGAFEVFPPNKRTPIFERKVEISIGAPYLPPEQRDSFVKRVEDEIRFLAM